MNIAERIDRRLQQAPDAPAIEFEGRWLSWGWLADCVDKLRVLLDAAGVPPCAPVGLLGRNRPQHHAALLAIIASGRCVVLLNSLQSGERVSDDVGRIDLAVLVASEVDWPGLDQAARAAGMAGIELECAVGVRLRSHLEAVRRRVMPRPGIAVDLPTSGTTGAPKRIPLSLQGLDESIVDFARIGREMGELPPSTDFEACNVQYAPIFHIGGLDVALQAASEGRPYVLMERFSAEAWHRAVKTYRPCITGLPPAMIRAVLAAQLPRADLASVKAVRSGAAALDVDTKRAFEEVTGIAPLAVFGATEFAGVVASWSLDEHRRLGGSRLTSTGRVRRHVADLRVVGETDGRVLPHGEAGLLEVRAPRARDGWQRTSDLASMDADDFLIIHGRADHAINRGGFKVLPDIVVSVLRRHPAVYDAVVVGLPDERLGEVPVAVIELREGMTAPATQELDGLARLHLAKYQVPVAYRFVARLPRTSVGKVIGAEVRELFGTAAS